MISDKRAISTFEPNNPIDLVDSTDSLVTMAKKAASTVKKLYDVYMEVGFTQEQAFELVKDILRL